MIKCVPHVQHEYFSSLNQSDHCFLASSLPLPSSLRKLPSVKACRPIMSRSWDDLVDDSSDDASPCDEVENVTLDLPNVSDELNAGVSVAETSVSTPEDVCNRIKKNLTTVSVTNVVTHSHICPVTPSNVQVTFMFIDWSAKSNRQKQACDFRAILARCYNYL